MLQYELIGDTQLRHKDVTSTIQISIQFALARSNGASSYSTSQTLRYFEASILPHIPSLMANLPYDLYVVVAL